MDDSWKDASQVSQEELLDAVQAILNKNNVPENQHPSLGCSIKWK